MHSQPDCRSKVFQDRAPEYILIIAVPILSNALVPQFHVNRLVLGGIRERGNLPIHVFKRGGVDIALFLGHSFPVEKLARIIVLFVWFSTFMAW